MTGSVAQMGKPVPLFSRAPKKIRSLPERLIWTGKTMTNPTIAASSTGARGKRFGDERARRNPTPMPRKLASRTKLEKYER